MTLLRLGVLGLALLAGGCAREGFDWAQGEDFLLKKKVAENADGSVDMHFVSLVNAPGDDLYKAFIDVEHHEQFVEGVTESKLVSGVGPKKVIDITNQVFGRPNRARIEWTIDRDRRMATFRTIQSDFTDNSAEYHVETSPDGNRAKITADYHLRDKGGHPFPLYTLKQSVIDGYLAAVRSVKRKAIGGQKPEPVE